VSGGARDGTAARAALLGFLASVGAIAILTWLAARFLADLAPFPIDSFAADPSGADTISPGELVATEKGDFYQALVNGAQTLCILTGIYWLTAYLLGAARARLRGPSVLLGAALVAGAALSLIMAAPRFIIGPLVDACARRYAATYPDLAFSSLPIHRCESWIDLSFSLAGLLLVVALLAASLRLRYRQRRPPDTA